MLSQSARKSIHRAHHLDVWVNLSAIDFRSQEFDLSGLIGLVHVDVPGAWSSVGAIAPSIAALLQRVLKLERRLFGPDAKGLAASSFKQDCESGSVELWDIRRQYFHHSSAVIDGAVCLME